MSKKHFIALAARFREEFARCTNEGERRQVARCVILVADIAAQTNPLFDRARFMSACEQA
ncbi:hypothetical protein [Methylobacterium fujisawaense]